MNSHAKPANLDEELASKWIDDPQSEPEAGWNAVILLYRGMQDDIKKLDPNMLCQDWLKDELAEVVIALAEILGIFEDDPQ